MKIQVQLKMNRPAAQVWHQLGDEFANIQNWFKPIVKSYELEGEPKPPGAPCAGRICEFSNKPNGMRASERIKSYDTVARRMEIEVEMLNAPAMPVSTNLVIFEVREAGPNASEVFLTASPGLKIFGYMMYPMVMFGMRKAFVDLLKSLKLQVEQNEAQAA
jgi:hypothetical protein